MQGRRGQHRGTSTPMKLVALSMVKKPLIDGGIFTPVDDPQRTEVPNTPNVAAIVEGYTGTETISMGEVFEPTPCARAYFADHPFDGAQVQPALRIDRQGRLVRGNHQDEFILVDMLAC